MPYDQLEAAKIIETVQVLQRRISERFPDAGLTSVCGKLVDISRQAQQRSEVIAAVNDVENLTTGMARKIWQKLMVLQTAQETGTI